MSVSRLKLCVLYGVPVLFSAASAGLFVMLAVIAGWWVFGPKTWLWELSALVLGGGSGAVAFLAALAGLGWRAWRLAKQGALEWWLVWGPFPVAIAALGFAVVVVNAP